MWRSVDKVGPLRIAFTDEGLKGALRVADDQESVPLKPGGFCLVPACLERVQVTAEGEAVFLRVEANQLH